MTETQKDTGTIATDASLDETMAPKGGEKKSPKKLESSELALKDIVLPEHWNREKLGNNSGLTDSIKSVGLVQPLAVRPHPTKPGKYILVDGRRRYASCQEAGLTKVPVYVKSIADDLQAEVEALIANLNREDMTDFEKAMEFKRLSDAGKKNKEIARFAGGKSEGYVSQHLAVFRLPENFVDALQKGKITFAKARALSRLDTVKNAAYFEKIEGDALNPKVSAEELDTKIDAFLNKQAKKEGKERSTAGKTKAEKKRGPAIKTTDYTDNVIKQSMAPVTNKTKYVEYFEYYTQRIQKTSSKTRRTYLEGVLEGLELGAGLKELS
jgi:ParB/RepB/Spo0J family partition protein